MKQNNNNMIVALSLVCKYLSNENKNHTRMEIISIGCVLPLLADSAAHPCSYGNNPWTI